MEDINREENEYTDIEEANKTSGAAVSDCKESCDDTVCSEEQNTASLSEDNKEDIHGKSRRTRMKKDGRSGFIKGVAAGIVLCMIAALLY